MTVEAMQVLSESEALEMIHIGPPFRLICGGFGIELSGGTPPLEAFGRAMLYVKSHMDRGRYLLGDLANLAEANHGEAASQVIDPEYLGDEKETSENRFVAKNVSPDLRMRAKSWQHAKTVAHLRPEQQEKYLQMALDEDWIPSKLRNEIMAAGSSDKTSLRFMLIVDTKTEAKQKEWAKKLESEGFSVTLRNSQRKEPKAKKAPKAKRAKGEPKNPVTAKRKGTVKMYTRRKKQ
jgi:hypothetical protein